MVRNNLWGVLHCKVSCWKMRRNTGGVGFGDGQIHSNSFMLFSPSAPKLWNHLCQWWKPVIEASGAETAPEQLLMLKGDTRKLHRKFLTFNRTEKLMLHHEETIPAGLCSWDELDWSQLNFNFWQRVWQRDWPGGRYKSGKCLNFEWIRVHIDPSYVHKGTGC